MRPADRPAPLSAERIYEQALAVIDADGLTALSMRRLGRELGVDPMAVYHHVANKDAVLHGVVRLVFRDMVSPRARGPWTARVREWARAYRAVAEAHPHLVLAIITDPESVAVAAGVANEALDSALRLAGLRARDVELATGLVVDYVNGFVLALANSRPAHLSATDLDTSFEFGLSVIIRGLKQLVP